MVISSVKAFKQPLDYIINEMSLANLMLYSATLASGKPEKKEDTINGDDPNNRDLIDKIIKNG